MPKDAFYFSHDANARNDLKCIRLRREMGMAGYGIYWCLLEMLREESTHVLRIDYLPDIAANLGVKDEDIDRVIKRYELFVYDDSVFYSKRLLESMQNYNSLKNKLSEAGRKGGLSRAKAWVEASLEPGVGIKEKKRKEKKIKGGMGERGETAKGVRFDADKKNVYFADRSKQPLGKNQLEMAKEGKLKPNEITKGIAY